MRFWIENLRKIDRVRKVSNAEYHMKTQWIFDNFMVCGSKNDSENLKIYPKKVSKK